MSFSLVKTLVSRQTLLLCLLTVFVGQSLEAQRGRRGRNGDAEVVSKRCEGIGNNDRVSMMVKRFSVSNRNAQGQFGSEISTILSNALVETSCYKVLVNFSDRSDWEDIIADPSYDSSIDISDIPQLIITGDITEYQDEFISVGPLGMERAHIGFVLQIFDPVSKQIVFSRSFERRRNKPKPAGSLRNLWNINLKTQAMADILEEAILEAAGTLVDAREELMELAGGPRNGQSKISYNRNNCEALSGDDPSVMVIIPEVHISRPAPDPAGETEIIRQLIAAGFRVIDPSVYDHIRSNEATNAATKDAAAAATLGAQFGADIIIIGEAFSEMSGRSGSNIFSCSARVEARAVRTADASILGADGQHASGSDRTELTAAKISLRNAGGKMAGYFLQTFCENGVGGSGVAGTSSRTLNISVSNASFGVLSQMERSINGLSTVQSVKKSLAGNQGNITVVYEGNIDPIAELLASGKAGSVEITEFSDNKISVLAQ